MIPSFAIGRLVPFCVSVLVGGRVMTVVVVELVVTLSDPEVVVVAVAPGAIDTVELVFDTVLTPPG